MQHDEATEALADIQARRAVTRKAGYHRSRLDRYRAELVQLHLAGGSLADLQLWLRTKKRTKVERSTIQRFLKRCPEAQQGKGSK